MNSGLSRPKSPTVKVCGITRLQDAQVALRCGAGALGFVFYPPSPRLISAEAAAEIIADLPPYVVTVGVFVDESSSEINRIAQVSGFDRIQLHGGEPYSQIAELERPAYRAFRLQSEDELQALAAEPDRTVLLDTFQEGLYGGTGQPFDWGWARKIAESRRVILAGGLTAHNVVAAVAAVRPYGLDVSSSMESTPGRKDPARIEAFFDALDGLAEPSSNLGGAHGGEP